ncbi:YceI family protein [Pontibacter sp. Tf4]|uniref:YceI family protein n=1 Tax=Pontibacter sp. Tf4 TaxID=2761620 RepID=UPI001627A4D0|nr:YceI family protein [Pontibacter sp. Tf4]MBB6610804.1 YceI family protein [Pontibacter sp. Tf4]
MQAKRWSWLLTIATVIVCAGFTVRQPATQLYRIAEGRIHFKSDAPLELIEASSTKLKGLIRTEDQTFAFSVANESFEGFNSALQREHFNENYMESARYPNCTFSGKIIEPIDFTKDGSYSVRAKGKLSVHGVEVERIIKANLAIKGGQIRVESSFIVPLQEHNITIPKVVYQKIAEEILVEMSATLTPQK